jgi:hypothetical protein
LLAGDCAIVARLVEPPGHSCATMQASPSAGIWAVIMSPFFHIVLNGTVGAAIILASDFDGVPKPLPRLPPGTVIERPKPRGATTPRPPSDSGEHQILLVAQPRLAAGDLKSVPRSVFHYASRLHPALVASIRHQKNSPSAPFRLSEVAVGFTIPKEGRNIVITSATQLALGADFDLISRQILAQNEKQLAEIVQVARNQECVIFDIPARVLRTGEHRLVAIRHLAQLNQDDGNIDTLVWLLENGPDEVSRMIEGSFEWLPSDYREDRRLHVDRDKFFFGIPTPEAFALMDIPRGQTIPCPPALRRLAASSRFSATSFDRLSKEIQELLAEARE